MKTDKTASFTELKLFRQSLWPQIVFTLLLSSNHFQCVHQNPENCISSLAAAHFNLQFSNNKVMMRQSDDETASVMPPDSLQMLSPELYISLMHRDLRSNESFWSPWALETLSENSFHCWKIQLTRLLLSEGVKLCYGEDFLFWFIEKHLKSHIVIYFLKICLKDKFTCTRAVSTENFPVHSIYIYINIYIKYFNIFCFHFLNFKC